MRTPAALLGASFVVVGCGARSAVAPASEPSPTAKAAPAANDSPTAKAAPTAKDSPVNACIRAAQALPPPGRQDALDRCKAARLEHPFDRANRPAAPDASARGFLEPELIQGVVRLRFGALRRCYEQGLRTQPELRGRVSVKFVIDASGAVSKSEDVGSDLPDPAVVQCIVRAFGELQFPRPDDGIVTVVYPIIFSPAD